MAKQQISKEAFRTAIIDAATRLFIERGFEGTNMGDIAQLLGVTRSAVYYYFRNKQEILEILTAEVTLAASQRTTAATANLRSDPAQALRTLFRGYMTVILTHPLQFRVVERNESSLPLRQRTAAGLARRTILNNFTAIIERGVASGDFRPVDSRLAAFALIGMGNWTAWWYKSSGRRTPSEIVDLFADMAIHAIVLNGKGLARKTTSTDLLNAIRDNLDHLERLQPTEPRRPARRLALAKNRT